MIHSVITLEKCIVMYHLKAYKPIEMSTQNKIIGIVGFI